MGIPLTGDFDRLGTNYGLHQYTVADVAELSALPTELWPAGNTVHVDSVKCLFVLETRLLPRLIWRSLRRSSRVGNGFGTPSISMRRIRGRARRPGTYTPSPGTTKPPR